MYHVVLNMDCFETFSDKRKKMSCIENIFVLGVLQETYLLLQFRRYNKIYDFISFTMTRSRASHAGFANF